MDAYLYRKERVGQPDVNGIDVDTDNIIDFKPKVIRDEKTNIDYIEDFEIVDDSADADDKEYMKQECTLACIFQRGNDPVDKDTGVRWNEVLLGEIQATQLIEDINEAVKETCLNASVTFTSETDKNGQEVLAYSISTE